MQLDDRKSTMAAGGSITVTEEGEGGDISRRKAKKIVAVREYRKEKCGAPENLSIIRAQRGEAMGRFSESLANEWKKKGPFGNWKEERKGFYMIP